MKESGGKGAQKYRGRENVVRKAGDSDPPPPQYSQNLAISRHLGFVEQGRLGRERNLYQGDRGWGWQNTIEPLHLRPLIVGMSSDVM